MNLQGLMGLVSGETRELEEIKIKYNLKVKKSLSQIDISEVSDELIKSFDSYRVFYDRTSGYKIPNDPILFEHGREFRVTSTPRSLKISFRGEDIISDSGEHAKVIYATLSKKLEEERARMPF